MKTTALRAIDASGMALHDSRPAVGLTIGELRELIRAELDQAVESVQQHRPALLTVEQTVKELGCSEASLSRMRERGLPCVFVCSSPRFELDHVLEWLRNNAKRPA